MKVLSWRAARISRSPSSRTPMAASAVTVRRYCLPRNRCVSPLTYCRAGVRGRHCSKRCSCRLIQPPRRPTRAMISSSAASSGTWARIEPSGAMAIFRLRLGERITPNANRASPHWATSSAGNAVVRHAHARRRQHIVGDAIYHLRLHHHGARGEDVVEEVVVDGVAHAVLQVAVILPAHRAMTLDDCRHLDGDLGGDVAAVQAGLGHLAPNDAPE